MKCMGLELSGTSYLDFDDVKVPVENLIGKENEGFKYIMYNFNHERWAMIVVTIRYARICFTESFKYAHKRITFGKKLIESGVIRAKLGDMIKQIEVNQSYLDYLTFQMTQMDKKVQDETLGPIIAMFKVQCSRTLEFCVREAVQILGGIGYTRGGQGDKIERIYRETRALAILGGSEEILLDFGMRTLSKLYSKL